MSESTQQTKPEAKRVKGTAHKIAPGSVDAPDVGRPVDFVFTKPRVVKQGKGRPALSFPTCSALVTEMKAGAPVALKLCVPGGGVERVVALVEAEKGKTEPEVVGSLKLGKDVLRFVAAAS